MRDNGRRHRLSKLNRRAESVLVVVYTRAGDVLLMNRQDVPGFWQSITGALKQGESALSAACRELREETGIVAEPVDHKKTHVFEIAGAWRARYHPSDTHNTEHVFSLQLEEAIPVTLNKREHSDSVWLPFNQALEKVSSPTNEQAINDIVSGVSGA